MVPESSARGFSLIEVLIATVLFASIAAGVSHLAARGVTQAGGARSSAVALALAQSKLEELRGSTWRYDAAGLRLGAPALAVSPAESLAQDAAGYADSLDRFGEAAISDGDSRYRRRWAITQPDPADEDTLALVVCVFPSTGRADQDLVPEACVSTIRTRQP